MIVNNIAVPVNSITVPTYINVNILDGSPAFPFIAIGRGSYIVSAQVHSMLNFDVNAGVHNIQIGSFCSIADDITLLVNMNHDYQSISTSASSLINPLPSRTKKIVNKGQIIIQNDVWIGHGVTVLSGVTIRNGAVVAANAHVVKDVPPYAIVGGNPAKIIKYRFTDEQIKELQSISWWDWETDKISSFINYERR